MAEPNFDADTIKDAMDYFVQRIPELARHGWKFVSAGAVSAAETGEHWGVVAAYKNDACEYRCAVYVLKSRRGQGLLSRYIADSTAMKFITVDDCNVASFYQKRGRDVLVLPV